MQRSVVRGHARRALPHWSWLALPAVLLAVAALTNARTPTARARALDTVTLSIISPTILKGPVGTNLTVQLMGAGANQTYNFAYELASAGCPVLGASAQEIPSQTTDGSGNAQFSFAWPADSGKGTFVLCAVPQNMSLPSVPIQSQNTFTVLSTTLPAITIEPAPTPTPTGTVTSTATAAPQNGYTIGESVIVHGTGFLPGGTTVQIALAGSPNETGTVFPDSSVNADRNGKFDITVTLDGNRVGTLYLQAETTDGGQNQPPSLLAFAQISISQAPTPTPTPTATSTPTAGPTPTPGGGPGSGSTDGTLRFLSIAGLGSFSLLLLLVGTALLISAGSSRSGMG